MSGPAIILIRPQMGENIGAAARAMANFGLSDLRLVNPRDGWPNAKAEAMSSGALPDLVGAQVFETFEEAVADCQMLFATTAQPRDMMKPITSPTEACTECRTHTEEGTKCAFIFGPERNGLENDEIALCRAIITIPVTEVFSSINLAQAVNIMGYQWYLSQYDGPIRTGRALAAPATHAELAAFLDRLVEDLDASGFFRSAGLKPTMESNIRNIFSRSDLSTQEINTLQGILSALQKPRQSSKS